MKQEITVVATITAKEYKSTSVNGNPSFFVWFKDQAGRNYYGFTASDAACGYSVANYINKQAKIVYHVTLKGSLIIDYIKSI